MRAATFIATISILWTAILEAEETLPALTVNGHVYSNAIIFKVTATDIYFDSADGIGNAKLKNLSPDLQKHFHYNLTNAIQAEQKQAAANAQYYSQIASQPTLRPPDQTRYPNPKTDSSDGSDLSISLKRAKAEGKMVLLDFTGSDWCGWCIKFKEDVLSTSKFTSYAANKLIFVEVDFPRNKAQTDAVKRNNQELQQRFGVNGYPTFVLLNSDGKELGRQVGYLEGGPNAFITKLEKFSRK